MHRKLSRQMETLLIFDGMTLGNWILLSLDFSVLLEFFRLLHDVYINSKAVFLEK